MISKGTKVGSRYRVVEYVASGGMQDVYRTRDELTDQVVALKTPQFGQANTRFHTSARLSARVNHYGVAKTFDYLEDKGSCYLIEEFVEGKTLEVATLAMMPQVDPHLGAHLLLRLCKGLAASHAASVAHRDLKPSNILVSDDLMVAKITDFGIATLAESLFQEAASHGEITRSTSGTIKGALPYMAPEMIFRKAGDLVGTEADIWSLGAVMFRLLTGEYPFGEAMMVPVNVQNKTRVAWPKFMLANPQYAPLSKSLMDVVDACLTPDKDARPKAADLVQQCENLCFFFTPRQEGAISQINQRRGFIRADDGQTIFFHYDSVYGSRRPVLGKRVTFCANPGSPYYRAHPVVVLS
jgi:serine/threonine-protein kinase